jgi:hypothetical protein
MSDQFNIDEVNWEDLLPKLLAYASYTINGLTWFRSKELNSYLKGKQLEDYVYEAINEILLNPAKFDPTKGMSFETYLKKYVLRHLIFNDNNSKEQKSTRDFILKNEEEGTLSETLLPYIEATFDEQIDFDEVMRFITERVGEDKIVEEIFMGVSENMKRREIIAEFGMNPSEYNNGIRRLDTILKTAAAIFNLKTKKNEPQRSNR